MTENQVIQFNELIKELQLFGQEKKVVYKYTNRRKNDIEKLTTIEAAKVNNGLKSELKKKRTEEIKIISGFMYGIAEHLPHWKHPDGKLNYEKALALSPKRKAKSFNDFTLEELKMLSDQYKRIRRTYGTKVDTKRST